MFLEFLIFGKYTTNSPQLELTNGHWQNFLLLQRFFQMRFHNISIIGKTNDKQLKINRIVLFDILNQAVCCPKFIITKKSTHINEFI